MKRILTKRVLPALLAALLCVQLLPAIPMEAEAAEGDGSTGAFGITANTAMSDEDIAEAEASAPYGATDRAVTLFTKEELYLTSSSGSYEQYTHIQDYNDANTTGLDVKWMTQTTNIQNMNNKYQTAFKSTGGYASNYVAVDTVSVNAGNGKEELVALVGLCASGYSYLELRDQNDDWAGDSASNSRRAIASGLTWLEDCDDSVRTSFAAITAGDFDGDGQDAIVVYSPPTEDGKDAQIFLYEFSGAKAALQGVADRTTIVENVYTLLGQANGLISATSYKNVPWVNLVAEDVDKDGYDELIITAGMHDVTTKDGTDSYKLGTQVFIYDYIDGQWVETAQYAPTLWGADDTYTGEFKLTMGSTYPAKNSGEKTKRYVWSSTCVGNIIASDGADFPEIITVGYIDTDSNPRNITVVGNDGVDKLGVTIVRCTGMKNTTDADGSTNYQGVYEFVECTSISTYPEGSYTLKDFNKWVTDYWFDDASSLITTACFAYDGIAEAEALFIEGHVYTWEANSSNEMELTLQYSSSLMEESSDGARITTVAVGNFNGNQWGREQLYFGITGEDHLSGACYAYYADSDGANGTWSSNQMETWFSGKDDNYLSLTSFDYDDDGIIVQYEGVEKTYSGYSVMAVLEATPYFGELLEIDDNDLGEANTTYAISKSEGTETEKSHGLQTSITVGFDWELSAFGSKFENTFETTVENNFTWSTSESMEVEYGVTYQNNTGENAVVVCRVPMLAYIYKNLSNNKTITLYKTLAPNTAVVTVEEYNEVAQALRLQEIDEEDLCTPGQPDSYHETAASIVTASETSVAVGSGGMTSLNSGNVEKSISYSSGTSTAFGYELSVNVSNESVLGVVKLGFGAGYNFETQTSIASGEGMEYTASVNGPTEEGYSFNWNMAVWKMELNGVDVPVVGFIVQDVVAPASPPTDVDFTDLASDSVTLTWETGARAASSYRIYRILSAESTETYSYVGSVSGDATEYEITGLSADMTYTFVMRAYDGATESVDSERLTFVTPKENGTNYVTIGTVASKTASVGDDVAFTAVITKSVPSASLTLQWQKRTDSGWADIEDANSSTLTVSEVSQEDSGMKYRLVVSAITMAEATPMYYYSNVATLTVGKRETSVAGLTLTAADGTALDGSGTLLSPYVGSAAWTLNTDTTVDVLELDYLRFRNAADGESDNAGVLYQLSDGTVIGNAIYDTEAPGYYSTTKDADTGYYYPDQLLSTAYVGEDGSPVEGFAQYIANGQIKTTVETEEDVTYTDDEGNQATEKVTVTRIYAAYGDWDGESTDVTVYWLCDGAYYTLGDDGTYTAATESVAPGYKLCYDADGVICLQDVVEEDDEEVADTAWYYRITSDGVTKVDPQQMLCVDGEYYSIAGLTAYVNWVKTGTQDVTVATAQSGTAVTIRATAMTEGKVLAGQSGVIVIIDLETGSISTIDTVTDENGVMTADWTASGSGIYSVRASVIGGENYKTSTSDGCLYYMAVNKDTSGSSVDSYRLLLQQNGQELTDSVTYGAVIAPKLTVFDGTDWTDAEGTVTYRVTLPDGTETDVDGTYFPTTAGKYIFSALDENGETLAAAYINVTARKLTVTPAWGDGVPGSMDDIELELDGALSADAAALRSCLVITDTDGYFSTNENGAYTFDLSWSEDEDAAADVTRLRSAYSVTLSSATIRRVEDYIPVTYQASDSGHGVVYGFCGSSLDYFVSGDYVGKGSYLTFQADPEDGYTVGKWIVNGVEITEDSEGYTIGCQSGSNQQTLTIDALNEDTALAVQVEFANQIICVTYQAGSHGSLTAATAAGSDVESGAAVVYGTTVVFTAAPDAGYMVSGWTVDGETYTWPGTSEPYRENVLTLSGLSQSECEVSVSYETQRGFVPVAPTFTEESGVSFADGTVGSISIVNGISGGAVEAGGSVDQGTALTYTASFADAGFTSVERWEYSTDGGETWTRCGSGSSFTLYDTVFDGDGVRLQVRAVISVSTRRTLSWSVSGLEDGDSGLVTVTAASGSAALTSGGSYPVNAQVTFSAVLADGCGYTVIGWSDGVDYQEADPNTATLTLTENTEVILYVKSPTSDVILDGAATDLTAGNAKVDIEVAFIGNDSEDEDGFVRDGETENTFAITADQACIVLVKSKDEEGNDVYEAVEAVKQSDGSYQFTTALDTDEEIVITLKGDMDFDGQVTNKDILLIKRHAKEKEWSDSDLSWMDQSGDGKVNNKDILLIKRAKKGIDIGW